MARSNFLRLRELFAGVMLLDPSERSAYLDRECGDDETLRREVEALMQHDPGPGGAAGSLAVIDAEIARRQIEQFGVEFSSPSAGDRVGNIRIVELLGAGGMGQVYVGYDETLQRRVALKVIGGRHRLSPEARARFLREARILSQLDHPNICRIYDYLTHGEQEFLVLELIDGPTLTRAAAEGLSFQRKLEISGEIAGVLAAAHREGIIHRDLKPDNIMLTRDGKVKVLDFGIAREVDAETGEKKPPGEGKMPRSLLHDETISFPSQPGAAPAISSAAAEVPEKFAPSAGAVSIMGEAARDRGGPLPWSLRTEEGRVIGTPVYMSPEQARGEAVSTAGDMYSFGLLLQTLFTGKSPYPDGLKALQILQRAQRAETQPATGVERDVANLIEQLKSPAPAARPTAAATVERLRWVRLKPRRRLRMLAVAAAVVVIALVGLKYAFDLRYERALAVEAREEADFRRGQAEDLIGFMLGDLREKLAPVGRLEILDDVGDKALEYFASLPEGTLSDEELARRSEALRQIGDVRMAQGDLDAAMEAFQESLELTRDLAERDPDHDAWQVDLGAAYFWVGYVRLEQKNPEEALAQFQRYAEIANRLVDKDPANPDWQLEAAYSHNNLAEALRDLGDLEGALSHYEASVRVRERLVVMNPDDSLRRRDLANSLSTLGVAQEADGRWEQAIAKHQEALEIRRDLLELDPEHTDWQWKTAISHHKIGVLHLDRGELSEALEHFNSNLRFMRPLVRQDPAHALWARSLAMTEYRLGLTQLGMSNTRAALAHFETAEEVLSSLVSAGMAADAWAPEFAMFRLGVGSARLLNAEPSKALRRAEEALRIFTRLAEVPNAPSYAYRRLGRAHFLRGLALERLDRFEEAGTSWRRALAVIEPLARDSRDPRWLGLQAKVLICLDRLDEALPILTRLGHVGYRESRLLRLIQEKDIAIDLNLHKGAVDAAPQLDSARGFPHASARNVHYDRFRQSPSDRLII